MREKIVEKKEFDVLRKKNSLTGNRTPAACVTGRNTDHYTIKDRSNRGRRTRPENRGSFCCCGTVAISEHSFANVGSPGSTTGCHTPKA